MAHHKSAVKRHRQNEKRRVRNRTMKTRMKNVIKSLARAEKEGEKEAMQGELNRAKSVIDKAAKKGVIHWRAASRKKSRLAKGVNRLIA